MKKSSVSTEDLILIVSYFNISVPDILGEKCVFKTQETKMTWYVFFFMKLSKNENDVICLFMFAWNKKAENV